jgi:hypothetical protein
MGKNLERRLKDLEIRISPKEDKKPLKIVVVYNDDEIPPADPADGERLIVRVIKTIVSNREEAAALKDP